MSERRLWRPLRNNRPCARHRLALLPFLLSCLRFKGVCCDPGAEGGDPTWLLIRRILGRKLRGLGRSRRQTRPSWRPHRGGALDSHVTRALGQTYFIKHGKSTLKPPCGERVRQTLLRSSEGNGQKHCPFSQCQRRHLKNQRAVGWRIYKGIGTLISVSGPCPGLGRNALEHESSGVLPRLSANCWVRAMIGTCFVKKSPPKSEILRFQV